MNMVVMDSYLRANFSFQLCRTLTNDNNIFTYKGIDACLKPYLQTHNVQGRPHDTGAEGANVRGENRIRETNRFPENHEHRHEIPNHQKRVHFEDISELPFTLK